MHCETDYDNEPYHVSYYIGKEMVDEEAYRLAYQEHDEENAVWYDFTQENIDTYIR
jgi:hypothetical protein